MFQFNTGAAAAARARGGQRGAGTGGDRQEAPDARESAESGHCLRVRLKQEGYNNVVNLLYCSPPTPDSGLSLQALQEASDYAMTEEGETSEEEAEDQEDPGADGEAGGQHESLQDAHPRRGGQGAQPRLQGEAGLGIQLSAQARGEAGEVAEVPEAADAREAMGEQEASVPVVVVPRLRVPRLRVRGPSAMMLAAAAAARRVREEPLSARTMPQGGGQRPLILITPPNIVEPVDSDEESGEEELKVYRAGRRSQ